MKKENRAFFIAPFLLVALNIVLKLLFITSNSISGDEPFSIYHAQMDVTSIISLLSNGNNPPLYEIILHYWIDLFGISPLSVRLPSLIFSSATVYFIYRIGKDFFSFKIAIVAGLIFTFSNFHVFFAHEARVYPFFALLTSMSMYYFLKIVNGQDTFKNYAIILIINLLMVYSHYFAFFVILIQSIVFLMSNELRKNKIKHYLILIGALLLLYIPNIKILLSRFFTSSVNGTWVQVPNGVESLYNMLWSFSNAPVVTVVSIVVIVAAFVKLIITKNYRNISISNKLVIIWFVFPFFFLFLVSFWIPMFLSRYLVFVSLGYYILLAASTFYLIKRKTINLIIPSIFVILFIATYNPNVDNKRHAKEAIDKIKELKTNETMLIICPNHFVHNFAYYYNIELFKEYNPDSVYSKITQQLKKENIYVVDAIEEVNIKGLKNVLYFDAAADFASPNNNIINTLNKTHQLKNKHHYNQIFNIYEFSSIN